MNSDAPHTAHQTPDCRIVADLHTHTIMSGHAFGTVSANAEAAARTGLKIMAVTDHGPSLPDAPAFLYFRCRHILPESIAGVEILGGIEANIVDTLGNLDLNDENRGYQDIVLIGFHAFTPYQDQGEAGNTRALVRAIAQSDVDVVAHAETTRFPVDLAAAVAAGIEHNVIFEINNRSFVSSRAGSQDNLRRLAQLCLQHRHPVVVTSDAHAPHQIGCFANSLKLLAAIGFPEELILNADEARLRTWLAGRHPNRRPREKVE